MQSMNPVVDTSTPAIEPHTLNGTTPAAAAVEVAQSDAAMPAAGEAQHLIQHVPYWRLMPSPHNVRRKKPTGTPALSQSIAINGLMQNLIVHEIKDGRRKVPMLGVCAGQRREAALDLLFEAGKITRDFPVPVKIVSPADAVAASLIENRDREEMHIADEARAFGLLAAEGRTIEEIAERFTTSAVTVKRRLKLTSVSPKLLELFRDDEIRLEQITALALTDDHALQERLWFEGQPWQREASHLREAITESEVDASTSPLALFVGLDAYEAAGGVVRRDLFSDDTQAGYIADMELLNRLVVEQLTAYAERLQVEEGWGWIEIRTRRNAVELADYDRLYKTMRPLTKKEQRQLVKLEAARDEAVTAMDEWGDAHCEDDPQEVDVNDHDRLELAVENAEEAVASFRAEREVWEVESLADAGAFVMLDSQGGVHIQRGLVRRVRTASSSTDTSTGDASHGSIGPVAKIKPVHSEVLCRRLTAHRTAIAQAELVKRPDLAVALVLARLLPVVFEERFSGYSDQPVEINAKCAHDGLLTAADDMVDSPAWKAIQADRDAWLARLPLTNDELVPWLLDQSNETIAPLFAFSVAATLDSTTRNEREHPVADILTRMNVDIAAYWQPTGASYFNHVTKARVRQVVAESVSLLDAAPLAKMKKDVAAAQAERKLAGRGWVPYILTGQPVTGIADAIDTESDDTEDGDDDA